MLRYLLLSIEVLRVALLLIKKNRKENIPALLRNGLIVVLTNWDMVLKLIRSGKLPKDFIKRVLGQLLDPKK
jgi:hypothetical protein